MRWAKESIFIHGNDDKNFRAFISRRMPRDIYSIQTGYDHVDAQHIEWQIIYIPKYRSSFFDIIEFNNEVKSHYKIRRTILELVHGLDIKQIVVDTAAKQEYMAVNHQLKSLDHGSSQSLDR